MFKLCVIFLVFLCVHSQASDYEDFDIFHLENDIKDTLNHSESDIDNALEVVEAVHIKRQEEEILEVTESFGLDGLGNETNFEVVVENGTEKYGNSDGFGIGLKEQEIGLENNGSRKGLVNSTMVFKDGLEGLVNQSILMNVVNGSELNTRQSKKIDKKKPKLVHYLLEREHIQGLFDELNQIKSKLHHLNEKLENVSESVKAARVNNVVINVAKDDISNQSTTAMPEVNSTKSEEEWVKWATVKDEEFDGMPVVKLPNGDEEKENKIVAWIKEHYVYLACAGAGFTFFIFLSVLCYLIRKRCCKKRNTQQRAIELSMEEKELLEKAVNSSPFEPAEVSQMITESAV